MIAIEMNKNNFVKKLTSIFLVFVILIVGYCYNLFIFKIPKIVISPCIPNDATSMILANAQIRNIRIVMVFIIVFTIIGTVSSMVLLRNFSRLRKRKKSILEKKT